MKNSKASSKRQLLQKPIGAGMKGSGYFASAIVILPLQLN